MTNMIATFYRNRILNLIYEILAIPAIIIHELSHIIFGLILGVKLYSIQIKMNDSCYLNYNILCNFKLPEYAIINFLIAMAPIISVIIICSICWNIWILIYFILFFKRALPSIIDIKCVKNYSKNKKEKKDILLNY